MTALEIYQTLLRKALKKYNLFKKTFTLNIKTICQSNLEMSAL
jgi:hypothetical protein